jgi:hypothetical protein
VSQDWKIWWWLDIILPFLPATAADAAAASSNEVPASLNARSHRRPLPPPLTTQSAAKIRRRTYNPHILQYSPTPGGGGGSAIPSKLFPLFSDLISRRLSFVRIFHSPPDFAFGFIKDLLNSGWKLFGLEREPASLTSESLLEDGDNGGGGVGSVGCRLRAKLPRV